jgi:hypothetical protein
MEIPSILRFFRSACKFLDRAWLTIAFSRWLAQGYRGPGEPRRPTGYQEGTSRPDVSKRRKLEYFATQVIDSLRPPRV